MDRRLATREEIRAAVRKWAAQLIEDSGAYEDDVLCFLPHQLDYPGGMCREEVKKLKEELSK